MTVYLYKARVLGESSTRSGTVEAESSGEAAKKLKASNLFVLEIKEQGEAGKFQGFFKRKKVPLKEKIIFTRQLSVMVRAGLSIVKAMEALHRQSENEYFREVMTEMMTAIRGGSTLSKSMGRYPKVFSEVYVAVIKAGEETGQLADVLLTLADQQEKDSDLIGKVKSAMIYPAVILCTLIGVVFLIVFFVLPSLKNVFAASGQQLPIMTRVLLGTSDVLRGYYYIIFPVLIAMIYGIKVWFGTKKGQGVYDTLKIKIPVFGGLTKKLYMARFSRTMAMLIKASLPILQSIRIVQKTIDNVHYKEAFVRIERAVESGKPLSAAIDREPLFPAMVSQLTNLGEESGNLETVLMEVANFYDKEVDTLSRNLSAMLEPILLIIMGIGVGFVVAAVLGPIYGMVQNYGG
ncbi:MAG TPA: type II secretion system F family protein [Candidatus Saccharimonadales bacterium]|nr:type II secretion system F family protein [Candidatus Saccharimonadales bacterium]